jgi:hypothetical protein
MRQRLQLRGADAAGGEPALGRKPGGAEPRRLRRRIGLCSMAARASARCPGVVIAILLQDGSTARA